MGEVVTVDRHGVGIKMGHPVEPPDVQYRYLLFVPWESVTAALFAAPEQDLRYFGARASDWEEALDDGPEFLN
jgi:hypothetical protein